MPIIFNRPKSSSLIFLFVILFFNPVVGAESREESLVLDDDEGFSLAPKYLKRVDTYRPKALTLNKKAKEIYLQGDFFSKSGTYDLDGNATPLDEGNGYQEMNAMFGFNYGVGEKLEVTLEGRFRNNQSDTPTATASNSGFESVFFGARYSIGREGPWTFALGFGYRQTFYSEEEFAPNQVPPQDHLVLGEGGVDISFGGLTSYVFSPHCFLSSEIYYVRRPSHISPEIQYNAHLAWPFSKVAFLLGTDGIYSMGQDPFSNDTATRPIRSTGATSRYNSINRSEVSPFLGMNLSFTKFRLDFKASQVMAGSSTDQGNTYSLTLVWGQTGISKQDKKIGKFKEYHVEGSITKVSPRGKFLKIDQGVAMDVEKGMRIDFFKTDFFGGNVLVASGEVFEVGTDWAIIRVVEQLKPDIPLEVGMTARGY